MMLGNFMIIRVVCIAMVMFFCLITLRTCFFPHSRFHCDARTSTIADGTYLELWLCRWQVKGDCAGERDPQFRLLVDCWHPPMIQLLRCIYKRPSNSGQVRVNFRGLEGTTAEYWGTQFTHITWNHCYLVGGFKHDFYFPFQSISYMGCHPFHWLICFNMVQTTNKFFFHGRSPKPWVLL